MCFTIYQSLPSTKRDYITPSEVMFNIIQHLEKVKEKKPTGRKVGNHAFYSYPYVLDLKAAKLLQGHARVFT